MRVDDLSKPERRLWMEFPFGTHIDLRSGDAELDDPACAQSWGPERTVRAEVITALLVGRRPDRAEQQEEEGAGTSPSVFLSGARILGRLDLRGIDFEPPLLLQQCALDEPLVIADSMARSVRLYGCHLPGVEGAWLKCAGDLHLRDCRISGTVDLAGAYIGGQLVLSSSTLSNPGEIAVRAEGLVVAGDLFCRDGALVEGEFTLQTARIGGEVRLTGSTLRNPGGTALRADRITVEKNMYCREGFRAEGEVRLSGAQVRGQLNFNRATLHNPGQVALYADQLVVGSHLYCHDHFSAEGEIRLVAARISGEVRFSASRLSNPGGTALRADRLVVAEDMYCRQDLVVDGEVSLRGAHIKGQLNFNHATLHNPGQVALYADQLVVGSHLYCHDHFSAEGEIRLVAARIGGEVRFSASRLSNPGETALRAERMFVAADMYCREGLEVDGMISLRGAHIAGQLNFNDATLRNPGQVGLNGDQLVVGSHLYCQNNFMIDGMVSLVAARVGGEVRFSAATLSHKNQIALRADRLVVEADMYCRERLEIDGPVSLRGTHVKGDLSFSSTRIHNAGGAAIQANQLNVGNDLCCDDGFTAEGMIDLTDVHVSGELSFSRAKLSNPEDISMLAPRLIVDKDVFCRDGFEADGTVCLIGAHVGGKLSLTRAKLTGASLTDRQLCDNGIKEMLTSYVKPEEPAPERKPPAEKLLTRWWRMLLHPVSMLLHVLLKLFRGIWRMLPASWKSTTGTKPDPRKQSDAIVSGQFGLALVADGLSVDLDMTCDAGFTARGEIRLKGVRIGRNLDFDDSEVNNKGGIALNAEDVQAERMLMPAKCPAGRISLRNGKMVELDDKRGVRPDQIDITGLSYERLIPPMDPDTRLQWLAENDYEPQPYDQLAHSYRQLGYDESARKVQLAQERRRRDTLKPARKAWGYLQDWTIGYGFLPGRAAALFGLVLLIGVTGFWIFPLEQLDPDLNSPQFNPFFYTLDVLVPFADFGQRDLWKSTVGHEIFKVFLAVFGWTLAITAIAGLNRALTRS